jgi:hypothetical protein
MTDLVTRRRRQRRVTPTAIDEIDLLLRETESLLLREIEAVRELQQDHNRGRNPQRIYELPLRLLRLKKNRSILESAILAYTEKKMRELAESKNTNLGEANEHRTSNIKHRTLNIEV